MATTKNNGGTAKLGGLELTPAAREALQLLGPSPLAAGEDPDRYECLLAAAYKDIKPTNTIELILFRDVVDDQWEIQRLREVNAGLVSSAKDEVTFMRALERHKSDAILMAEAVVAKLGPLADLQRMIALNEHRRNAWDSSRRRSPIKRSVLPTRSPMHSVRSPTRIPTKGSRLLDHASQAAS
jgi:hypothetical protein